jgi:hypothetical protein
VPLVRCSVQPTDATCVEAPADFGSSVARRWNEATLSAIRIDLPQPTVHARNLYHVSAAMYDAWAAYDCRPKGVFYTEKHVADDIAAARRTAISYAAYRVLSARYKRATNPTASQAIFDKLMYLQLYDTSYTDTDSGTPAAVGNKIAQTILEATLGDGSNEENNYADTSFTSSNLDMVVLYPNVVPSPDGDPATVPVNSVLPNLWQRLFINASTSQNGIVTGTGVQNYIGSHWGDVETFALGRDTNADPLWDDVDPGQPAQYPGDGTYLTEALAVLRLSSKLDPAVGDGALDVNLSPSVNGNRPLGTHTSKGYTANPVTGEPYSDNKVKQGDHGRVLAEFWADGPKSETPPGHWNVIANEVSDNPRTVKKIGGTGDLVGDLEWDVKLYLALNGAAHDAAVAAWGVKRKYESPRPITMIRYAGAKKLFSTEAAFLEAATTASLSSGGTHENAFQNANRDHNGLQFVSPNKGYYPNDEADLNGALVVTAWNHEPLNPVTTKSGVKWILVQNWIPYQKRNFVTPAFPGYVSGHSTFSRSMAEVMTLFTGSPYFPGGLHEMTFTPGSLKTEYGPSSSVTLQWVSYYDAADEAGISRLWGGIHISEDDFKGRIMGSVIGPKAYDRAKTFW